jgi:hypothetical protein
MQVFDLNIKFVIYFGINVPSLRKAIFLTNVLFMQVFYLKKVKFIIYFGYNVPQPQESHFYSA